MTIKTDRAAPARAALKAKRDAAKSAMKPAPNWDNPAGEDRYAKFRASKKIDWQDYSGEDRLRIDQDLLNDLRRDGIVLSWVTKSVMGDTHVCAHAFSQFERNGWQVVQPDDIPGIPVTECDGLVLMARSTEIDNKAREHERRKASSVVNIKREGLLSGDIPGVTLDARHVSAVRSNRINRTIEPLNIDGE